MLTFRVFASAALIVAGIAPACATDLKAPVPGHPGITYERLLKQAMRDLSHEFDGTWSVSDVPHLRDIDGKPVTTLDLSFGGIDALSIKEDGHRRLVLVTEDNSGTSGFDQIAAVFDDSQKIPVLLDVVDVGRDDERFRDARATVIRHGPEFLQKRRTTTPTSYSLISPLFLRGGKLRSVMTLFSYGVATCSSKITEQPEISTAPDAGSRYRAIVVRVTVETMLGEADCGEGQKPPKHSKKIVSDIYRWNEKKGAFVPRAVRLIACRTPTGRRSTISSAEDRLFLTEPKRRARQVDELALVFEQF